MTIAEIVKSTRESRGMTQEQFGEQLGVTKQAVSSWELGDRAPGGITLMGLLLKYKDWRFDFALKIAEVSGLLTE